MTDGFTIEYSPVYGSRQRIRYEPRSDESGYWRIDEVWNGCRWRIRGREPVRDVVYEDGEEVFR